MDLQKVLGDEVFNKLKGAEFFGDISKAFEGIEYLETDEKFGEKYIPRDRLNQEIEKKKALEKQLEERDAVIAQTNKDLEELKALEPKKLKEQIQTLTEKNVEAEKTYKEEIQTMRRSTKIREILAGEEVKANSKYVDFLESKLDSSKLAWSEDNENVTGITEQATELKKNYPEIGDLIYILEGAKL